MNMNAFTRVNISIGTQTRSSSTMINTHWQAKIDAQLLFYFMILLVGRIWIDLAASMNEGMLELYTDAHGTLAFDKYKECSPKNHERTHGGGVHWLKHQSTDAIASLRSDHEGQEKIRAFSTCIQSQLGLTNCCRTPEYLPREVDITILFFVLKAASEEHNVIRVLCGNMFFVCLPMYRVYKISIKANIAMANRGEGCCTSKLHARTPLSSAFSC